MFIVRLIFALLWMALLIKGMFTYTEYQLIISIIGVLGLFVILAPTTKEPKGKGKGNG